MVQSRPHGQEQLTNARWTPYVYVLCCGDGACGLVFCLFMFCLVGLLFYVFGCIRSRENLGGLEGRERI